MDFDMSEVDALADDLARAPRRDDVQVRKVMKRSALQIKRGMQQDFSGHNYAPGVPASLEFEADATADNGYEIGELDSAGRQWGIAAILAFGTSNNAPVVDHTAALHKEAPIMADYLAEGAQDSVLGGRR